jgi:hypothetical protein
MDVEDYPQALAELERWFSTGLVLKRLAGRTCSRCAGRTGFVVLAAVGTRRGGWLLGAGSVPVAVVRSSSNKQSQSNQQRTGRSWSPEQTRTVLTTIPRAYLSQLDNQLPDISRLFQNAAIASFRTCQLSTRKQAQKGRNLAWTARLRQSLCTSSKAPVGRCAPTPAVAEESSHRRLGARPEFADFLRLAISFAWPSAYGHPIPGGTSAGQTLW